MNGAAGGGPCIARLLSGAEAVRSDATRASAHPATTPGRP